MRGLEHISALPELTTAVLKHQGIDFSTLTGRAAIEVSTMVLIAIPVISEELTYLRVLIRSNSRSLQRTIRMTMVRRGKGFEWMFVCPSLGSKVRSLFYVDEQFISSQGYYEFATASAFSRREAKRNRAQRLYTKLAGNSVKGPARGRHRINLLRELRKLDAITLKHPEIAKLLAVEHEKDVRKRQRNAWLISRNSVLSFNKGWMNGPVLARSEIQPYRYQNLKAPVPGGRLADVALIEAPKAAVENHAVLHLDDMLKAYESVRYRFSVVRMGWPQEATDGAIITIIADLRVEDQPYLAIDFDYIGKKAPVRQVIELAVKGKGNRWLMRCPVEDGLVGNLYLRNGRFASQSAQRLVYRSRYPNLA